MTTDQKMLHFRRAFLACLMLFFVALPRAQAGASPLDDIPLAQALERLSAMTGIPIVYSSDTVHAGMRVPAPPEGANVEGTLHAWLARWDLDFVRIHEVIVVRATERDVDHGVIAGRVVHAESGAPLAGIDIRAGNASATSAPDGSFLLQPVARGEHAVVIASRGFTATPPAVARVDASGIGFVYVNVVESVYALDAIVVVPGFYELDAVRTAREIHLGNGDIRAAPKLGGEVLRAVGYLPGVMQDGASARAQLRGGAADETLYLFDGVRLYDPFHLRDFLAPFSFLDPQRIASASVHVGAFPVALGGRMSGVIEFQPVDAFARFGGEAEINVFSTGFLLSDSFHDGASAWVASARRGHLDVLADSLEAEAGTPSYFDAYLRLEHETAAGVQLSASVLGAHDRLIMNSPDQLQATRADYDNQYYWLRAALSPTPALDIATTFSSTKLGSWRTGAVEDPERFSGTVSDRRDTDIHALAVDVSWRIAPSLRLAAGAGLERRAAWFDYQAQRRVNAPLGAYGDNGDFDRRFDAAFEGEAQHMYAELRSALTPTLHIDAGVRIDRQDYPDGWRTTVGPRLGASWSTTGNSTLRLSAGRYWQSMGIEELRVEDGMTEYLQPQHADSMVVGWDWNIRPDLQLRAEMYRKELRDPWIRHENLLDARSLVPELESDRTRIAPQSARMHGIEATLAREHSDDAFSWWLTASLAKATDRINGRDVARGWDQRWRVDAGVRFAWQAWTITAIAVSGSGTPYTPLVLGDDAVPVVALGEISSERLPTLHRLDLRVSREWRSGNSDFTFYAEAINAVYDSNVCCVDYTLRDAGSAFELERRIEQWYGIVPNIGLRWRF